LEEIKFLKFFFLSSHFIFFEVFMNFPCVYGPLGELFFQSNSKRKTEIVGFQKDQYEKTSEFFTFPHRKEIFSLFV
jgi:hypothetical protein